MGKERLPGVRRRFPVVNGIFYPDNPEIISDRLSSWGLKDGSNTSPFGGQVIIAPHGAWDVSGGIAGAAFASIQKREAGAASYAKESFKKAPLRVVSRVVLLGPCHGSCEEGIYLSESAYFQTPLGDLPVDLALNRKLASCSTLIRTNDIPHLSDHSLEVLLPLVKYCLDEVSIVPILMGGKRPALISSLARALKITLETHMRESLIIISSNVSRNADPVLALSMAEEFRDLLERGDAGAFLARLCGDGISACGGALVGALLESGLSGGRRFTALTRPVQSTGDEGETIYYGAFTCDALGG